MKTSTILYALAAAAGLLWLLRAPAAATEAPDDAPADAPADVAPSRSITDALAGLVRGMRDWLPDEVLPDHSGIITVNGRDYRVVDGMEPMASGHVAVMPVVEPGMAGIQVIHYYDPETDTVDTTTPGGSPSFV